METLLYYPYVNPPTVVLWQALLYWDDLASIMPPEYDPRRPLSGFRTFIPDLQKEEIYTPVYLDNVVLDYNLIEREVGALFRSYGPAHVTSDWSRRSHEHAVLDYGKIPGFIEQWLVEEGLVERGPDAMYGPKALLDPIIAILARHASASLSQPGHRFVLHTDAENAAFSAFAPLPSDTTTSPLPAIRLELGSILPVPSPNAELSDVLAFRARHEDERARCRAALAMLADRLSSGSMDPDVALQAAALELRDAAGDLSKAAKSRNFGLVARGVGMLVTCGAAAAASMTVADPSLAPVLNALGAIGVNILTQVMRPPLGNESADYTYIHELQRAFKGSKAPGSGPAYTE